MPTGETSSPTPETDNTVRAIGAWDPSVSPEKPVMTVSRIHPAGAARPERRIAPRARSFPGVIALQSAVLAQANDLDKFSDSFRHATETRIELADVTLWLAALGAVVLVVWILAVVSDRYREHKPYRSSWGLFLGLAKAQKLQWSEIWLVWRLARWNRLKQPGLLFLEPGRFLLGNLPLCMKSRAPELKAIADRLFLETNAPTPQVKKPKSPAKRQPTSPDGDRTTAVGPVAKPRPASRPVPHDQDDDDNPLAGIDLSLPSSSSAAADDPTETPQSKPHDAGSDENKAACDFVVGEPPSLDLGASLFETHGPTVAGNPRSPA